jgi:DNA primase
VIPQDFLQTLLDRVDIVDVIEAYVPLRKAGANYVARCPFHSEKTPSFTVSQGKQFYHCFGCAAHGTAIGFLMEYAGLDFVDAVRDLAARVGMKVPDTAQVDSRRQDTDPDALCTVMERAWPYYRTALKSSERAVAYLKGRGLTGEVAARYGLGYAPDEWRNLAACFTHYEDPLLVRAGLVIDTDGGRRYDRFRDRIMFPIFSGRGRVIAFGGRVLDKGEPKYLNSPETPLFAKGTELYGLVQARQAIRDSGRVLVVEGYMDVIALAQHGVGYAVATLGTAVSGTQIRKLVRMAERVIFAFDGDEAGRKAAVRALEQSLPLFEDGKRVDFLFLPSGEDPDSYIRQHGGSGFEALLEAALPLSEFFVRELLGRTEVSSVEGKAKLMQIASPWLREIHAPFLGHLLRRRIAELAGMSDQEAGRLLGRAPASTSAGKRRILPLPSPARTALLCLLAKPELAVRIDPALLMEGDAYASALGRLLEFAEKAPNLRTARDMAEVLGDTAEGDLVRQAAGEVMTWPEDYDVMADLEGALSSLRSEAGRRMSRQIESRKPSELSAEEKAAYLDSLRKRKNSTFGGDGEGNEPSDQ